MPRSRVTPNRPESDREIDFRGRAVLVLSWGMTLSLFILASLAGVDIVLTGELSQGTSGLLLPIFTGIVGAIAGFLGAKSQQQYESNVEEAMKITEVKPDGTRIEIDTDSATGSVVVEDLLPDYQPGDIVDEPPLIDADDDIADEDGLDDGYDVDPDADFAEDELDYDADEDDDRG